MTNEIVNLPSPQQPHPILHTARLTLRPLQASDAARITELCSNRAIAYTTRSIPHPYPADAAQKLIDGAASSYENGTAVVFAICPSPEAVLAGTVKLAIEREDHRAELGYWLGEPYWGKGYASEAAQTVVRYGLQTLRMHRITAQYLVRNPASGKVMERCGMQREGLLRHHRLKWGVFEDIYTCAIVAPDAAPRRQPEDAAAAEGKEVSPL